MFDFSRCMFIDSAGPGAGWKICHNSVGLNSDVSWMLYKKIRIEYKKI